MKKENVDSKLFELQNHDKKIENVSSYPTVGFQTTA